VFLEIMQRSQRIPAERATVAEAREAWEAAEYIRKHAPDRMPKRAARRPRGRWRPLATVHGAPPVGYISMPVRAVLERQSPLGSVIEVTEPMTWLELTQYIQSLEICVCHRWDVFG
jgi:hypothetical protein